MFFFANFLLKHCKYYFIMNILMKQANILTLYTYITDIHDSDTLDHKIMLSKL